MQISSQSIKRNQDMKKKIIDLQVFYQIYQKSLNVVYMINVKITFIRYCQNINADFRKEFSTQYYLPAMIEKLRKRLDSRGDFSCSFD